MHELSQLAIKRYWLIHRADYQRILYDAAKAAGATVLLGSPVESVEEGEDGPFVVLKDAQQFKADLVVGADGIRSKTRKFVLKENIEAVNSRNCAYRATVPAKIMKADPVIAHLMKDINSNCWIGHERHIMAYPICNGELYNIVMSHPGQASIGRWNEPGNLDEMKKHYCNFDPIIQKVLEHVDYCSKWKLAYLPPLSKWVSDSGRVVLIGDAAHGMLPYVAQGAAMSIEDGAALAECLDRVQNISDIPNLLQAFQAIRKPRCEEIALVAQANGDLWHVADGPDQVQRDCEMRQEMDNVSRQGVVNPNKWSDKDFQPWLFGYDTVKLVSR